MNHLSHICRRAKAEDAIMRKLHGVKPEEERKVIEDDPSIDLKNQMLMDLPHMASAMELRDVTLQKSTAK